jgi:hypothetical protein
MIYCGFIWGRNSAWTWARGMRHFYKQITSFEDNGLDYIKEMGCQEKDGDGAWLEIIGSKYVEGSPAQFSLSISANKKKAQQALLNEKKECIVMVKPLEEYDYRLMKIKLRFNND